MCIHSHSAASTVTTASASASASASSSASASASTSTAGAGAAAVTAPVTAPTSGLVPSLYVLPKLPACITPNQAGVCVTLEVNGFYVHPDGHDGPVRCWNSLGANGFWCMQRSPTNQVSFLGTNGQYLHASGGATCMRYSVPYYFSLSRISDNACELKCNDNKFLGQEGSLIVANRDVPVNFLVKFHCVGDIALLHDSGKYLNETNGVLAAESPTPVRFTPRNLVSESTYLFGLVSSPRSLSLTIVLGAKAGTVGIKEDKSSYISSDKSAKGAMTPTESFQIVHLA